MGFRNKHGNRVPATSVAYILHNIAYTGKFYYDKNVREAIESGMAKNSSVKSSIEMWENERNMLLLEEQDLFNATKTFYEQSNTLLEFCKDCHSAFLKGNAEQKRTIVKIVCSNVFYDGENLSIVLHPAFESIVKMNLNNKKLPELGSNQQPTG